MANVARIALVLAGVMVVAIPTLADEQAAIDGCIDRVRQVGGPDAANGGQIISSDFSQAGTLVMLRDAGGTVWRCLAANDGTVEELSVSEAADDGNGAMAGSAEGVTDTVNVKFARGRSEASYKSSLTPGSSRRYVLGARNGQFLTVQVVPGGSGISYQIFNPDRSFLLDMMSPDKAYTGQLWQTGNHVVEVINRGRQTASFQIDIGIK
ncbi:hypothetical protein [Aminobacter sp. HY435]|uniref:hypothetical protein n=1 Tax=Aminobacter sp. HY435 TaxID=2970917 RepID=UPI0022B96D75|nr:hypothetical protein [Aminobacter sp. HY435]